MAAEDKEILAELKDMTNDAEEQLFDMFQRKKVNILAQKETQHREANEFKGVPSFYS